MTNTTRRSLFQRIADYWNGEDIRTSDEAEADCYAPAVEYCERVRSNRRSFLVTIIGSAAFIAYVSLSEKDRAKVEAKKTGNKKEKALEEIAHQGISFNNGKATYDTPLESCDAIVSVSYDLKSGVPSAYLTDNAKTECLSIILKEDGNGSYTIDLAATGNNLTSGFFQGKNAAACKGLYEGVKAKGFTGVGKCLDETVAKYNEAMVKIEKAVAMYKALQ